MTVLTRKLGPRKLLAAITLLWGATEMVSSLISKGRYLSADPILELWLRKQVD